jgi:hypothetical protein
MRREEMEEGLERNKGERKTPRERGRGLTKGDEWVSFEEGGRGKEKWRGNEGDERERMGTKR